MFPIAEIRPFLNVNCNSPAKYSILESILELTGSEEGIDSILCQQEAVEKITFLIDDINQVKETALLCMINLATATRGLNFFMNWDAKKIHFPKSGDISLISKLVQIVLDPNDKSADSACKLLCNLSRSEIHLNQCVQTLLGYLPQIMDAFNNLNYNKAGADLHYTGQLLSNLTANLEVRTWIRNHELSKDAIVKIACFTRYEGSSIRRSGAAGAIRNLCFDIDSHPWLLGPDIDLLSYLLYPLAGGEEFNDDEMLTLPSELQLLSSDKQRDSDPEVRIKLLEAMIKLCARRTGREYLRSHGAYYILREYHKWERNLHVLLACQNVIDLLIRTEDEVGVEDLSTLEVPEAYHERFEKMDADFVYTDTTERRKPVRPKKKIYVLANVLREKLKEADIW